MRFCYLSKFAADGVVCFSVYADVVSEGKLTVVMRAESLGNEKLTA